MKKSILFFVALIYSSVNLFLISSANAQSYLWAKRAGGTESDGGNSVTADASGNIIVTGFFNSSSITFGTVTLTNANSDDFLTVFADVFIVKYDPSGNVLWAKRAGGTDDETPLSVTTDVNGNIIVIGEFMSSSITFGTTTLTNPSFYADIFIVKYDPSGNVLWAKKGGGTNIDYGTSVTADASGNIIVTGDFRSPSITFGTTTLTNAGAFAQDFFIVKYDGSGNLLWAKRAGGPGSDFGNSVTSDASGNIIVTGSFFDPTITFGTTTLTNASASFDDVFIVKYDGAGNVLWAKSEGGTYSDFGRGVTVDASGNIIVMGVFGSSTITFGTTTLTNAGFSDIFIVKYDGSGNVLWAKSAGGTGNNNPRSVTSDASGNIIVTGYFFDSTITFETTTLTNTSAGNDDIFIVKYDPSGNVLWANSAGGTNGDFTSSVTADASGNIIVTGTFYSSSITFGTITLTDAGGQDIFIVKLNGVTGIEENEQATGVTIFPNPSSGEFQIQLEAWSSSNESKVEIYNVMGEKVYSSIINSQSSIIHLDVPAGIYFLQIKTEQGIANKKIIIRVVPKIHFS